MKYSGFQTCADLDYLTPTLTTGGDADLSDDDVCDVTMFQCQWKENTPWMERAQFDLLASCWMWKGEGGDITTVVDLYSSSV